MPNVLNTLDQWLSHISQSHPKEIELGLDRVKSVYQKMSFEARPRNTVVVAGTNGKGSTIALSQAGLASQGLRCGTYTSPHISKYNERVQLLGVDASDHQLAEAFQYIDEVRGDTPLTYFEFGTLAALYVLFNADLDVVLLEIGLGGRLDAVNIVDADISVITSIDIDHIDWLGDDIQQIGREKAGILRKGQPFLAGENLPQSVFECAEKLACQTLVCHEDFYIDDDLVSVAQKDLSRFKFQGFPKLNLPDNNILLAYQLIALLLDARSLDADSVYRSMCNVKLSGRLEQSSQVKGLYFDVGHNPHAARFLKSFLLKEGEGKDKIEVVFSALADKDVRGVVAELSESVDRWLIAPLNVDRAMSIAELQSVLSEVSDKVLSFETIDQALAFSLEQKEKEISAMTTGKESLVLVFGSFFTVEAAKKFMDSYE